MNESFEDAVKSAPRRSEDLLNWQINPDSTPSHYLKKDDIGTPFNSSYDAVQAKIKLERLLNESQKENEYKVRNQLEQSKMVLLDAYKGKEDSLVKQLTDCKQYYETLILEKERLWAEKYEVQARENLEAQHRHKESVEILQAKHRENEQRMVLSFSTQEQEWSKRVADSESHFRQQLVLLEEKHSIDLQAKQLVVSASNEAFEMKIKQQYDKKMKKYEAQIEEIAKRYQEKEFTMKGSLEEARRDVLMAQAAATSREQSLREELQLKDSQLIAIQSRLNLMNDYIRISEVWRTTAKDLASFMIQTCTTVQDLPHAPEPPEDIVGSVFQGFAKEDEVSRLKKQYFKELDAHARLRDDNVIVNRRQLTKALKHSKRVIERIQAEILPKLDNIGFI